MWNASIDLVDEIKKCDGAGATTAALVMSFVCIDAMTFISLPAGRDRQERTDFISWTDTYLKEHENQSYQYRGIDVYGARCALLHNFGSEADYHQKNPDSKKFLYNDGGEHIYNPIEDECLGESP